MAQAIAAGLVVVDHSSALATQLGEVVKQNAHMLLTRQKAKRLIDRMADSHPRLVEELVPKILTLGEVQKVLQPLLREPVSIRDLGTTLETLVEVAPLNKNPVFLVEAARHALGRAGVQPLLDKNGQLRVVTLDRSMEEECARFLNPQSHPTSSPIGAATKCHSASRRGIDSLVRGTSCECTSGSFVFLAGKVSVAQAAGTLLLQNCSPGTQGDPAHCISAVGRSWAMSPGIDGVTLRAQ